MIYYLERVHDSMNQNKFFAHLVSFILFVSLTWPFSAELQELEEVKELCDNMTIANKDLAKRAGYDLDALCTEFISITPQKPAISAPAQIARETVSSSQEGSESAAPTLAQAREDSGKDSNLKPFGYDLFANAPTTYAPVASIPVSGDYLLGPGDSLDILFYGKTNDAFSLNINREGIVDFPELGPVGLAGLTYAEAKEMLRSRIAAQVIGTQVSISMGSLRSIQIFVLGEAYKPGAYTVSSLATITNALTSAGGVTNIASLRNITLKRKGKTIANLDLYDLLLLGDTSGDIHVQAGDVIYIPTVGDLVSVEGQVLRPAIYELKGGESVNELINLAGGFGPRAFPTSSRMNRISVGGFINVFDLNLKKSKDKNLLLKAGDHLIIDEISDYRKNIVTLIGAVRHDGEFDWSQNMRISDVINRDKLQPDTDLHNAILVRELPNGADIEVLLFSPTNVFTNTESADNYELKSRDTLLFFKMYENKQELLSPYVSILRRQTDLESLPSIVRVGGTARYPGNYPLVKDMTVSDLIKMAGGLLESSYSQNAEIFRISVSNPERVVTSIFLSSLDDIDSLFLQPMDSVEFRMIPDFNKISTIELSGEFVFPGTYSFMEGETLLSVIQRAGGLTDEAFLEGSVFLRKSLREKEQAEINRLAKLLQDQVSSSQLRDLNSDNEIDSERIDVQRDAIGSLANSTALGRLVISMPDILNFESEDLFLQDSDQLLIPKLAQDITIVGEVRRPSSYIFKPGVSVNDYLVQSGGFTKRADRKAVYLVKANGEIVMPKRRLFRFKDFRTSLGPGDTIVVPLNTDDSRIRGIPLMAEVSAIIYQLALGAAAINTFNSN